jgi:hypothetical protein
MRGVDGAAVALPDSDGVCLVASAGQSLATCEIEAPTMAEAATAGVELR